MEQQSPNKMVLAGLVAAVLLSAGTGYWLFTRKVSSSPVAGTARLPASLPFHLEDLLAALPAEEREEHRPALQKLCTIAEPRTDGTWDVESMAVLVQLLGGTLESKAQALYRQDVIPSQRLDLKFSEPAGTSITRSGVTILGYADHRTDAWHPLHDVEGNVRVTQENLVDVVTVLYNFGRVAPPPEFSASE